MKYKTAFILAIILSVLPCFFNARAEQRYSTAYKGKILAMVVPTHTMARILADCSPRVSPNVLSAAVCGLKADAEVEILRDYSESWYLVESADEDASGWLPAKLLQILPPESPKLCEMSVSELEAFANIMDFPAPNGIFVWTDIARQKTHIFKKEGDFSHIRTLECATGKPSSPTTRGFFTIKGRGEWFYSRRLGSGGKYWVRFNETYLFHSVAMDKNKRITDGVLGERRSSGCVRLSVTDAEWLYRNVPDGAAVFIY